MQRNNLGFGLGLTKPLSGKEKDDAWSIDFGVGYSFDLVGYSFDLTERVSWGPGLTVSYDINSEEVRLDLYISVSLAF